MHGLISYCEQCLPHKGWSGLRSVNYEADCKALTPWLTEALAEANADDSFKGLWFGLNNPATGDETTADLYIAASNEFAFDSIDWAVDASFFPESGRLNSKVLAAVYQLAYSKKKGLGNDAEYPLALAYGAMAARAALEAGKVEGPFTELSGAAAGFDSGDFLFLGTFRGGEFIAGVKAG
jgi:hypothetical protein